MQLATVDRVSEEMPSMGTEQWGNRLQTVGSLLSHLGIARGPEEAQRDEWCRKNLTPGALGSRW